MYTHVCTLWPILLGRMKVFATKTHVLGPARTGPVGRAARLLLAVGFAASLGTLLDQGCPESVRDPETLADAPFVVLTVAMVAVWAILAGELAKLVGGDSAARRARRVVLALLAAAAGVAGLVGQVRAGAMWGSPLSDLVWALDVAMLVETIVALLLAVVLGTPGCEIGVWAEIGAHLLRRPASPPLCIFGLHYLDAWELRRRAPRREGRPAARAHGLPRRAPRRR